jgi:hypothetical protein
MPAVLFEDRLTKERRREVCIHEAAHAVIHALGGSFVYLLAVAPEDATEWQVRDRKGGLCTDLWGICSTSDFSTWLCMQWNETECTYEVDRRSYATYLRSMEHQVNEFHRSEGRPPARLAAEQRRIVRAHICGSMAGPAAEAIAKGQDVQSELDYWNADLSDPNEDLCHAEAMARLLPYRNEYEHAARVTEQALRSPDIWAAVLRLADELERVGHMDDVHPWVPEADRHWPPSPRCASRRAK